MNSDDPAWPQVLEALQMARRHANHYDIAADADFLLTTAAEIAPYLSEQEHDENE